LFQGIYAYATLKDNADIKPEQFRQELKKLVRTKIGAFAVPEIIQVSIRYIAMGTGSPSLVTFLKKTKKVYKLHKVTVNQPEQIPSLGSLWHAWETSLSICSGSRSISWKVSSYMWSSSYDQPIRGCARD
jgi:hypothetical protein